MMAANNDAKYNIVKKASEGNSIVFNWVRFKDLMKMWLLGWILSLFPILSSFITNEIENLTLIQFFNDFEFIYVSITMAIIVLGDIKSKNNPRTFWLNICIIITGTSIYTMLRHGLPIPILNQGANLSIFNMCLLVLVLLIGLVSYINLCSN